MKKLDHLGRFETSVFSGYIGPGIYMFSLITLHICAHLWMFSNIHGYSWFGFEHGSFYPQPLNSKTYKNLLNVILVIWAEKGTEGNLSFWKIILIFWSLLKYLYKPSIKVYEELCMLYNSANKIKCVYFKWNRLQLTILSVDLHWILFWFAFIPPFVDLQSHFPFAFTHHFTSQHTTT